MPFHSKMISGFPAGLQARAPIHRDDDYDDDGNEDDDDEDDDDDDDDNDDDDDDDDDDGNENDDDDDDDDNDDDDDDDDHDDDDDNHDELGTNKVILDFLKGFGGTMGSKPSCDLQNLSVAGLIPATDVLA
ncbi:hypothetical protein PoB_005625200 [Plakobranchus ocellatus]|uniref:Uncharacterized protein n=1 Tax=Plakobranchus ocellatus TaxID=259542 RepID=A0AAV4CEU4_9GAST|nr:hypothetical protein PoB_005625200 [Plakobranchus ocellatus]